MANFGPAGGKPTDLERVEFMGHCKRILRDQGFEIRQVSDPSLVESIAAEIKKPYLTKVLDPLQGDYTQNNCFWFILYRSDDSSRRAVGMLGARVDVLEKDEFIKFIKHQAKRLYGKGGNEALEDHVFPPPFYEIVGKAVYIGDLFIDPEFRGRTNINLRALLLLVMGLANYKWGFDWLYAFVRSSDAEHGYFQRYCFAQTYPGALSWVTPPAERTDSDYFGCVRDQDLDYLIAQTLARPGLLLSD